MRLSGVPGAERQITLAARRAAGHLQKARLKSGRRGAPSAIHRINKKAGPKAGFRQIASQTRSGNLRGPVVPAPSGKADQAQTRQQHVGAGLGNYGNISAQRIVDRGIGYPLASIYYHVT